MSIEQLVATTLKTGVAGDISGKDTWTLSTVGDTALRPEAAALLQETGGAEFCRAWADLVRADISICNLETGFVPTIEDFLPRGVTSPMDLFEDFFKHAPFTHYSVANNHILDAGRDTFVNSLNHFDQMGLKYFGGGRNLDEALKPCFTEVNGLTVGLLAFAQDENQLAGENFSGAAPLEHDTIMAAAEELVLDCDVPVIVMHEGFEFSRYPREEFRSLCRELATSGVKVVIGGHPHVPQGIETIGENIIIYSQGNFIFSAPYHRKYHWGVRTFSARMHFNGCHLVGMELIGLHNYPSNVVPVSGAEAQEIVDHVRECSAHWDDPGFLLADRQRFFKETFLPEFLGYISSVKERDGDLSTVIEQFCSHEVTRKGLSDILSLFADDAGTDRKVFTNPL
jgi:Bacterial capsule synthesis protein PGA_cap